MAMCTYVSYIAYAASLRGGNGNIITFAQFEEGSLLSETKNLISETCDNTESSKKSDKKSTITPLIIEKEIDAMSSGDDYDDEPMFREMLEDIC